MNTSEISLPTISRSADFSPCGKFRFRLDRWWADGPRALLCMTNPSKAGSTKDDPTICRCITLVATLGFPGFTVINWEPYIATDPTDLYKWRHTNDCYGEIHQANLQLIGRLAKESAVRILAWGNLVPMCPSRINTIQAFSNNKAYPIFCFGRTKSGEPKHPMARGRNRIKTGEPLELWLPEIIGEK